MSIQCSCLKMIGLSPDLALKALLLQNWGYFAFVIFQSASFGVFLTISPTNILAQFAGNRKLEQRQSRLKAGITSFANVLVDMMVIFRAEIRYCKQIYSSSAAHNCLFHFSSVVIFWNPRNVRDSNVPDFMYCQTLVFTIKNHG